MQGRNQEILDLSKTCIESGNFKEYELHDLADDLCIL